MRTKIFTFLVVLIGGLFIATSAFAAGPATPSPGQSSTYGVTVGTGFSISSYQWKIYTSDGTTEAVLNTDYTTAGLGTASSTTVVWTASSAGKKYFIWVQGTDSKGCLTDSKTFEVNVSSPVVCIANTAAKVGDVDAKIPTNTTGMCSLISTNTSGASVTGVDETVFYATITNGVASATYTVTYAVSSTKTATPTIKTATLIVNATGAGAVEISVKASDFPEHFDMAGQSAENTLTIAVTKATYNSVDVTGTCDYTAKVNTLPTISF